LSQSYNQVCTITNSGARQKINCYSSGNESANEQPIEWKELLLGQQ